VNELDDVSYQKKTLTCKGCGNLCAVTQFTFTNNNNKYFTDKRCERYFYNRRSEEPIKENFFRDKENILFDTKNYVDESDLQAIVTRAITHFTISLYRKIVEKELKSFKRYHAETSIDKILSTKDNPLPLFLQFCEGWLLPLEIVNMVKEGVKDVISVQPFGCISNHIVAKGIYRQLKDEYGVNMLLLDYESGTSNVNISNRLELFLSEN